MQAGTRRLTITWLILMGLSTAMAVAADVGSGTRLLPLSLAAIGLIAIGKSFLILRDYLGLRSSGSALAGFSSGVAAVLAIVVILFIATGK